MAEPGHADPASHPRLIGARPHGIDNPDDLMARYQG